MLEVFQNKVICKKAVSKDCVRIVVLNTSVKLDLQIKLF